MAAPWPVTMLSPSPLNKIRTNSKHGERIFHRKLQVGALASSKKFLRKTKEIQNRKKTRPPLTVFLEIKQHVIYHRYQNANNCCLLGWIKYLIFVKNFFESELWLGSPCGSGAAGWGVVAVASSHATQHLIWLCSVSLTTNHWLATFLMNVRNECRALTMTWQWRA